MTSREWLLRQLDMTENDLISVRRDGNSEKRWVMFHFYRTAGKTLHQIARICHKDHSSVVYGLKKMSPTLKALAEEYLFQYITEILHEKPEFKPMQPEVVKKTVCVKVPDYAHSTVVYKDVDVDEVNKPIKKIRKWDL